MTFAIQNVGKQYFDYDQSQEYAASSSDVPSAGFSEIQQILTRWKKDLFPEFLSVIDKEAIKVGHFYEQEATPIQKLSYQLLIQTHQFLAAAQAPTRKVLESVQQLFLDFAATLGDEESEKKAEAQQLALHPRLVTKCSEDFLLQLDKTFGEKAYAFPLEEVIATTSQLFFSDRAFANALRACSKELFPEKLTTREGLQELGRIRGKPNLSSLYGAQAPRMTFQYIASIANNTQEVSEDQLKSIATALEDLAKWMEDNNTSADLYERVDCAAEGLALEKEALAELTAQATETIKNLEAALATHQKQHKEATDASKKYGTLSEELQAVIGKCEQAIEKTQEELARAKEEFSANEKNILSRIKSYEESFRKASAKAKELAVISEDKALRIRSEEIEHVKTLSGNPTALLSVFEHFLAHSRGNLNREIQAKSWISRILFG